MPGAAAFLTDLHARAQTAAAEETAWRQEAARRGRLLEHHSTTFVPRLS